MKVVLSFLLFAIFSSGFVCGSENASNDLSDEDINSVDSEVSLDDFSSESCSRLHRGMRYLGMGVDITKLDLMQLDSSEDTGIKGPVIDFTCENNIKWTNAFNKKSYQLPDQVWTVNYLTEDWGASFPRILRSFLDVKNYLAQLAGVNLENGMFSNSASYKALANEVTRDSNTVIDASTFTSSSEATLAPPRDLELGFHAQRMVQSLPKNYDDNPEAFETFVETFGTHYFASGRFGPFMKAQIVVPFVQIQNKTDSDIQKAAKTIFSHWLRDFSENEALINEKDEFFGSHSYLRSKIYGGDFQVFSSEGRFSWMKTAMDNPWIMAGKVIPIYELIGDEKVQTAVKTAVENYMNKHFLKEIENLVKVNVEKDWQSEDVYKLKSILSQIRNVSVDQFPDASVVNQLGKSTYFHLAIPDWWRETKVCFQYTGDVENKYCSGKTPTCAHIGQFTELYQDWSRNEGGCHLSWMLSTSNQFDDWFHQVKLCFKFEATEDHRQCDNRKEGEECVKPNVYTPVYYDHTDGKRGGCEQTWKLMVGNAEIVPTWFSRINLCYRFRTFTKGKRGNKGFETICSPVNSYAPIYLDDTMFRTYFNYRENFIQWGIFETQ